MVHHMESTQIAIQRVSHQNGLRPHVHSDVCMQVLEKVPDSLQLVAMMSDQAVRNPQLPAESVQARPTARPNLGTRACSALVPSRQWCARTRNPPHTNVSTPSSLPLSSHAATTNATKTWPTPTECEGRLTVVRLQHWQ
jgi:hypothetical protein